MKGTRETRAAKSLGSRGTEPQKQAKVIWTYICEVLRRRGNGGGGGYTTVGKNKHACTSILNIHAFGLLQSRRGIHTSGIRTRNPTVVKTDPPSLFPPSLFRHRASAPRARGGYLGTNQNRSHEKGAYTKSRNFPEIPGRFVVSHTLPTAIARGSQMGASAHTLYGQVCSPPPPPLSPSTIATLTAARW